MWTKGATQTVDGRTYRAACSGWWRDEQDHLVRHADLQRAAQASGASSIAA